MNEREYAETVANNTARMIQEVTNLPDGSSRNLPPEVLVGVLNAQSNLAIAAALVLVAGQLKDHR